MQVLETMPDEIRVMTREDCVPFVCLVAGMKVVEPGNHRISNLFDNFCHKIGHDFLLLEEFLSFYEAQTKKRQEAVRHNLGEFKIGRDLK